MGMQCTFSYQELQASEGCISTYDPDSDTWSVFVSAWNTSVNLHVPEDKQADKYFCWFDIGSCSQYAINTMMHLIRSRISFTCS